ncbi:alpha-(1,3)-fucosyltransferase 7 [Callorhinchus milii]|uniref:Fucosyltransferase n=1 Tax=Callorhinchus milii TaxID=7868 RepID=A0A4W3HAT8_CALMI|nr:alpha-(1,3)-fucosyltransferase 7 [Callorhinchus milii]|eukprot:gi/632964743/ref/XP_007898545.1/ PREDICTED: alpha-(1,3)-fucosyltransferase 7 [Callorhinchus milii]
MALCSDFLPKKCKKLTALLVTGCFLYLIIINSNFRNTDPLIILVWHWPFRATVNLSTNVCLDLYGIGNCILTQNKSLFERADVLVVHHWDVRGRNSDLPQKARPPHQKWLWVNLESPSNTQNVHRLNGLFNWTMTYKTDSDIFLPYGELVRNSKTAQFSIPKKSKPVTWVVSNYHRNNWRAEYHASLSKYIEIDVYGRANNKPISKEMLLPTISQYAFYEAFENSVHKDYITEKLWRNAYLAGSVPVVLGPPRDNYEKFVPSDSFIHVNDFVSEKELANFLTSLWKNQSHYAQYFNWRRKYSIKMTTDWKERFCKICTKFHSLPQSQIYYDLNGWFEAE